VIRLIRPYISFDEVEADFRQMFADGMFTRGQHVEGRVVHAQRMDNVRRPDVTRFYRDKQGISNRTFDWAGFRTLVSPLPADGSYRIAIGRRSEDGTIQALACPGSLRIVDGVPDY